MSESGPGADGAQKWRDKYLDALDENEQLEREHREQLQKLQRALVRVSVAAEGQQPALDDALEALRTSVRGADQAALERALRSLDATLVSFDDERDRRDQTLRDGLGRLIAPLLAADPPRSVKKSLRELATEVTRQRDSLERFPELLTRLADLQRQALAQGESGPAAPSRGLFSRLLGREPEPAQTPEDEHASELPEAQDDKADRALFELNPNATLRDSQTVSAQLRRILTELLQSVEAQELEPRRVSELHERLSSGISNADLIPVLEEVRDLVLAAYMAATRAFALYLKEVDMELGDIYAVIDGAVSQNGDLHQASESMQRQMLGQFDQLQQQSRQATSLESLKDQVQDRLGDIRAALDQYRERAARNPVTEQLQTLAKRLKTMENEASKNREVLDEQRRRALTDPLTGAPNREAYNERIEMEIRRFQRYGRPLTLAVCDLDYFKQVNDTLGHQAGDRVLKVLASAIGKRLRDVDFFGRYGGEEFVVILPETTGEQAFEVLDRIRAAIARTEFSYKNTPLKLTLSIGLAELDADDTADTAFERADKQLYDAKAAGRNTCLLACGH